MQRASELRTYQHWLTVYPLAMREAPSDLLKRLSGSALFDILFWSAMLDPSPSLSVLA